jgi:hypothetical protein
MRIRMSESALVYLCGVGEGSPCEVLVRVRLVDGMFPPIIEWRGILYWRGSSGGYYRWLLKENVEVVGERDVVKFVKGSQVST